MPIAMTSVSAAQALNHAGRCSAMMSRRASDESCDEGEEGGGATNASEVMNRPCVHHSWQSYAVKPTETDSPFRDRLLASGRCAGVASNRSGR